MTVTKVEKQQSQWRKRQNAVKWGTRPHVLNARQVAREQAYLRKINVLCA